MKTTYKLLAGILLSGLFSFYANSQTYFLNENFEGVMNPSTGIPTNWTETGLSTDGIYSVGTSLTTNQGGFFAIPSHTSFVYTDDDFCNCDKSADRLILPTMDFSTITPGQSLKFDFSIFYPDNYGEFVDLFVSTNGGSTWTLFQPIPSNANWNNLSYDISQFIGNASVKFSFLYDDNLGWAGGFALDDVKIYIPPSTDLGLTAASLGEYTVLQEKQVKVNGFPINLTYKNFGSNVVNGATITATLYGPSNNVLQTYSHTVTNLASNASNTITFANFIPSSLGNYRVNYSATHNGDTNPVNDTISSIVTINANFMARDNGTPVDGIGVGAGATCDIGNLYTISVPTKLDSVLFYFAPSTVGTQVRAIVTAVNNGVFASSHLGTSLMYTSVTADASGKILYLPITDLNNNALILQPGTYYIGLEKVSSASGNYSLQCAPSIFTPGTVYARVGTDPYAELNTLLVGFDYTPIIRPYLSCAISTMNTPTDINCSNPQGSAVIHTYNGFPPYVYTWSQGGYTTDNVNTLSAGSYSVVVSDAVGCSATTQFTINTSQDAVIVTSTQTDVLCNGGATGDITLAVTGGAPTYTYVWTNSSDTTANPIGLSAGTYSVAVTDMNGCIGNHSVTIVEPSAIVANGNVVDELNGNDGSISLTVTGGTAPYTYAWSTGDTTAVISNLIAGTYSVVVTDANGCSSTLSFTVDKSLSSNTMGNVQFNIYPNPSNGIFNISATNLKEGNASISVRDITGKIVYITNSLHHSELTNYLVDLKSLNKGSYFMELSTELGKIVNVVVIQ